MVLGNLTRSTNIGIDGGSWGNRRGYGRFLRHLLPELVVQNPEWRFTLFLDQEQAVPEFENLRVVVAHTAQATNEAASAEGARTAADLLRMAQAVNRVKLDLFFYPTVFSYFPLLRAFPKLVGIHDVIADRNPQFAFAGKKQELLWRVKVRMAVAQATKIVTVSEYSKRMIAAHFGLAAEKFVVISEGASEVFRPMGLAREDFLLAVGGLSPNKNLAMAIRAAGHRRLLIVGDYKTDAFQSCYEELRAMGGTAEFLGYVPDAELAELYNRCAAFVMPSFDEGFGLPALEAMQCGAPVVLARGHALEEIGCGAALLADPSSLEEWQAQIAVAVGDKARLSALSVERAKNYSWARGAAELAEAMRGLL